MIVNGVRNPLPLIPTSVAVNAGQKVCKYVDARGFADSANGTATLQVSYTINGQDFTDDIVVPFSGDQGLPSAATRRRPGRARRPAAARPRRPQLTIG